MTNIQCVVLSTLPRLSELFANLSHPSHLPPTAPGVRHTIQLPVVDMSNIVNSQDRQSRRERARSDTNRIVNQSDKLGR